MSFTFIHSADWHLGKPFGQFPEGLAYELHGARFGVIDALADLARGAGAKHVLVAGDVFDAGDTARGDCQRALERMKKFEGVTWVLLPGNHDPLTSGGVWDRVRRLTLPPNVIVITSPAPVALADGVMLLPSPLMSRNVASDPTAWMDQAITQPGVARIGLAHGAVQTFSQEDDAAVRIAPDRAKRAGLAYLALGDWHGALKVSDRCWYSGTPEPDRFPDNDPGHALVVTASGEHVDVVKSAVARFTWRKQQHVIASADDLANLTARLEGEVGDGQATLLSLVLSGQLSARDETDVMQFAELWAARLKYFSLDTTRLARPTDALDLASLDHAPALRDAAETLSRRAATDPVAAKALLMLYAITAQARAESGDFQAGVAA